MISKEQIEYIANLAKLKFSEGEIGEFEDEFPVILKFAEKINEIDTDNIEPMYQVYDYNQVFREDIVEESLPREEALQNTVEKQYGYFKLLNIMD